MTSVTDDIEAAGPVPDDAVYAPTATAPGVADVRTRDRHQRSAQLPQFAADANRALAKRITESPKFTLAAAVIAFELLDADTQVDLVRQAKARHLRAS